MTVEHGPELIDKLQQAAERLRSTLHKTIDLPHTHELHALISILDKRIRTLSTALEVLLLHHTTCRVCGVLDISTLEESARRMINSASSMSAFLRTNCS